MNTYKEKKLLQYERDDQMVIIRVTHNNARLLCVLEP